MGRGKVSVIQECYELECLVILSCEIAIVKLPEWGATFKPDVTEIDTKCGTLN
jgi:hypothetical protein